MDSKNEEHDDGEEYSYAVAVLLNDEVSARIRLIAQEANRDLENTIVTLLFSAALTMLDPWYRLPDHTAKRMPPERLDRVLTMLAELHEVSKEMIGGQLIHWYLAFTDYRNAQQAFATEQEQLEQAAQAFMPLFAPRKGGPHA